MICEFLIFGILYPCLKPDDFVQIFVNLGGTESHGDFVHTRKESFDLLLVMATAFSTLE